MQDPFATEEERHEATDLMQNLQPLLMSSRSTHYPVEALRASQKEVPESKCLVFEESRQNLVEKLSQDLELDEKEVHVDGVLSKKGAFGVVYKGTFCGIPVAIKELREGLEKSEAESFRIEGKEMRLLHHPFICEYVGYLEKPFRIVTRFYPRDLATALAERDASGNPVLTREDKFRISYQLAAALLYLHKNGILHRDIKTDNILLDENNNVKLADFGLSMYAPGLVYDAGSAPGSPLYMAPEVLAREDFDAKCEVYTYGLMLYEIFTGRIAFAGVQSVEELQIRQKEREPLMMTRADWSDDSNSGLPPRQLWDFAKRCWSFDPKKRPTMEEVVTEIVKIGVKAAVPRSKTAENFWLSCSSFVYRDHLLLPELVKRCVKANGIDMERLIMEAVPRSWKLIDITDYWLLCCWYPNFFVSREAQKNMRRIVRSEWYVPDEVHVRSRIGDPKRQLFVIRPSSTNSFDAPFTLCASVNGVVTYHRIGRFIDETKRCVMFTCDSLIPGRRFSTITDVAEFVKTELHLSPATERLEQIYANPTH